MDTKVWFAPGVALVLFQNSWLAVFERSSWMLVTDDQVLTKILHALQGPVRGRPNLQQITVREIKSYAARYRAGTLNYRKLSLENLVDMDDVWIASLRWVRERAGYSNTSQFVNSLLLAQGFDCKPGEPLLDRLIHHEQPDHWLKSGQNLLASIEEIQNDPTHWGSGFSVGRFNLRGEARLMQMADDYDYLYLPPLEPNIYRRIVAHLER